MNSKRSSDKKTARLRKELGTMDRILICMGVFLTLFVIAMILMFIAFQSVPDTLIVSVFSCAGLECGVMGAIKNRKEQIRSQIREIEDKEAVCERTDSSCEL